MTLRKIVLLLVIIVWQTDFCNAQSDYSTYLDKAREKIEAGDCEAAQKLYNVYKELTGQMSSSLEKSIADCNKQKNSKKTYSIGDDAKDFIGLEGYKIAYLDASGKHGFAVEYDDFEDYPNKNYGPSIDELRIIYRNRHSLGLHGEFWSATEIEGTETWISFPKYYTIDFSTGKENKRRPHDRARKYHNLWIERF